jgi:hypothetical protein
MFSDYQRLKSYLAPLSFKETQDDTSMVKYADLTTERKEEVLREMELYFKTWLYAQYHDSTAQYRAHMSALLGKNGPKVQSWMCARDMARMVGGGTTAAYFTKLPHATKEMRKRFATAMGLPPPPLPLSTPHCVVFYTQPIVYKTQQLCFIHNVLCFIHNGLCIKHSSCV